MLETEAAATTAAASEVSLFSDATVGPSSVSIFNNAVPSAVADASGVDNSVVPGVADTSAAVHVADASVVDNSVAPGVADFSAAVPVADAPYDAHVADASVIDNSVTLGAADDNVAFEASPFICM